MIAVKLLLGVLLFFVPDGFAKISSPYDGNSRIYSVNAELEFSQRIVGVDCEGRPVKTSTENGGWPEAVAAANKVMTQDDEVFERHPQAVVNFLKFSGYRTGQKSFMGIGMASYKRHGLIRYGACTWLPHGGNPMYAASEPIHVREHHSMTYEVVLINCTFRRIAAGGGELYAEVDSTPILLCKEDAGALLPPPEEGEGSAPAPYRHQLVYCSPPIYGQVDARRIYEFIEYNIHNGVDYFVMYDLGGVDKALSEVFAKYQERGMLEVLPASNPFDWWCSGHLAIINDCAYRNMHSAKWVVHYDFDEYFFSHLQESLLTILNKHEGHSYVSFGSVWWSTYWCYSEATVEEGHWPIERMQFHWPEIFCNKKLIYPSHLCLDYHGYRKVAVDPRHLLFMNIHAATPKDKNFTGVDTDARYVQMSHYRGLIMRKATWCNTTKGVDEKVAWWARGSEMASAAKRARKEPLIQPSEFVCFHGLL